MSTRWIPTAWLVSALVALLAGCPGPAERDPVTQVVGPEGGVVTHVRGFVLELPPGALTTTETVTVSEVDVPDVLPANIVPSSLAYQVVPHMALAWPARVTVPLVDARADLPDGALAVYRWDGETWGAVGGERDGDRLIAEVDATSVFIAGTGASLHQRVEFAHGGVAHAIMVRPYTYVLARPDLDSPIGSVSVGVLPGSSSHPRMSLPQGQYSFCFQWEEGETDDLGQLIYYHRFLGTVPGDPAVVLHENTDRLVPPRLYLDNTDGLRGLCPPTLNVGPPPPPQGTGITMGDPEITLTWQSQHDLDLWVITPSGAQIGWANPVGPDGGRLDRDDLCSPVTHGGPEHIYWPSTSSLQAGTYVVQVRYWGACEGALSDPPTAVRLRLVIGNQIVFFPGAGNPELVMTPGQVANIWAFDRNGNVQ